MIWLTSFSFVVLLFTYQHDLVESRKKSSYSSKSPWANPSKANNFMKCLIPKIESSPVFPQQEKQDMESIVETMMVAISGMSNSKGGSAATLQAMNMAFASSMAELVIAEDVDDAEGIAIKTEALAQALKQCFRSTIGSVNRQFITEIKDLIAMFAREASEAGDDEGDDGGQFDGNSSIFKMDSGTGDMLLASGDYPSFDAIHQLGGSESGDVSSQLSKNLAPTFTKSDILKAVFTNRISPNVAKNVMGSAIQGISNYLNLELATSSQLKYDVMKALANVRPESDVNAYITATVPAISKALASKGILNQNTKNKIISQITMGMIKGVVSADPWNGINVANTNLQDDLLKSKTLNDQQRQLIAMFSNEAYPGDLDVSSANLGGSDWTSTYSEGDAGVNMQLGGSSGSSGADLSMKFTTTLGNGLLRSDTFRSAFKKGISSAAAGGLLDIALQQIAADLALDATTSGQLKNAILQAVTTVPQGSDSNAYAQAIAPAFARVLLSTNKLNDRNAILLGFKIATGLVKSISVNAPRYGIRLPGINLDNDFQKMNTFMVQLDSPQTPLSVGGDDAGSYLGGLDSTGSYPGGLDSTDAYPGDDAGIDMQLGGASGSSGTDLSSNFATTLSNTLLQSDTFRFAFKRGISSAAAGGLLNTALQQIAADLGLEATTLRQLRNAILQAVTTVPQGSDSNAYAQVVAPAFARVLVSTNKLNDRNAILLGFKIATGLVKSVSVNAPRYGISLPGINLDNDFQKMNTIMVQLDSPQTPLSLGGDDGTGSYTGGLDATGSYPGGLDSTDAYPGDDAGIDMQLGGASGTSGTDLSSNFAATLSNTLLQSGIFRFAFKRGISSAAAGGLLNTALQQIAADLGLEATTSRQLRNAILQAVTTVPQGSDSNAYAQVLAPAFARVLVSTNKLNDRNAKLLGSKIGTGLVKSVSVNAARYGIRLPGNNLDNDFQKMNTIMVQLDSPQRPLSVGGDDGTGSYTGGLDATSSYPRGLESTCANPGGDAGVDMQLGDASRSSGTDLSSNFAATLSNALLQSDTFRFVFKRGISSAAAGGLLNTALQQIADNLGLDATTSGQLRNGILRAVTTVPQGSDSNAYAQAIALAFSKLLVSTNKLNDRNAKLLGSKIGTGLVKSVSVNAARYGIRLPGINLDNDLQKMNTIMVQLDSPQTPLSVGGGDDAGSYLGGLDSTGAFLGGFVSTGAYSNDNQGSHNFSLLSVGGASGSVSSGSSNSLSIGSILDSPIGLNSPQANSRISGLTSSLVRAVGPSGFDADAFANGLKGTLSQLSKSGMPSDQAKVEGLMEALVALVQILNSSLIGQVDTATMSSTSSSMARALSSILA